MFVKPGNTRKKIEVKDKWLAEVDDPIKYADFIYTAFYNLKKENEDEGEEVKKMCLESMIRSPQINNRDGLKQSICVEKREADGDGHFYLLKKQKTFGRIVQRQTTIRELNLLQHKENGAEKLLGAISKVTRIANPYKDKHKGKQCLEVTVSKETKKPRAIVLLFDGQDSLNKILNYWKINNESAKASLETTIKHMAKHFNSVAAMTLLAKMRVLQQFRDMQIKKAQQKKQDQEEVMKLIFNELDKRFVTDFVEKWRISAIEREKDTGNVELLKIRQQEEDEINRKINILKKNKDLQLLDERMIKQSMDTALKVCYGRKQIIEEQEAYNFKQNLQSKKEVKVQSSVPQEDINDDSDKPVQGQEKATIEFKSVILPQNMNFIRPIVEISYTVVPIENINSANIITRQICNKKWIANVQENHKENDNFNNNNLKDSNQKQLKQEYGTSRIAYRSFFQCRLLSKLSDQANEWSLKYLHKDTQLYEKVVLAGENNIPAAKLEMKPKPIEEELLLLDLTQSTYDRLRMRVFESFNQSNKSGIKPTQQVTQIIEISDLAAISSHSKKAWISLNPNEQFKKQNFKINSSQDTKDGSQQQANIPSIVVNILREPDRILSHSPANFQQFMTEITQNSLPINMVDPLYSTFLPSIDFSTSELRYFLKKLSKENLSNSNSLQLAQFIISQAGPYLPNSIIQDCKILYFNVISKHLTSEYFKYATQSDAIQAKLLSKAVEDESIQTCEIINNINSMQHSIELKDLRQLLEFGVPHTFRSLYWYNFLQLKDCISKDQEAHGRSFQASIRSSDLLYNNYKAYKDIADKEFNSSLLIKSDSLKNILGDKLFKKLNNVISSFGGYLKANLIADLSQEQPINNTLTSFITKIFLSFHPTFMSFSTQPLSQLNFIVEQNIYGNEQPNTNSSKVIKNSFSDIKSRAVQGDGEWRQYQQLTTNEEHIEGNISEAEIFWFIVALYNLHFRDMVQIHDLEKLKSLKLQITHGVLAYEQLLSADQLDLISKNGLTDILQTFWVENYTSFFDSAFSSLVFTKLLDLLVFEFGLNLVDGFVTAFEAAFVTILQRLNLSDIHNYKELQSACNVEMLLFQQDFISTVYKNIDKINQTLDTSLLENRAEKIPFQQLVNHLYPSILEEFNIAEKKRKDLFEANAHSIMLDIEEFQNIGSVLQPYQSNMANSNSKNLESLHKLLPNKSVKLLSTSNYNINRRIFSDSHQDSRGSHKDYQQNIAVRNQRQFMPIKEEEQQQYQQKQI